MRADLFLKASRLCSHRSVAQEFCEAGRVSLNGHPAKSSHTIKVGDKIQIRRHHKLTTIRVLSVPDTRQIARKDAASLYEVLSEETLAEDYGLE
jgi:ribosomal 50S subunit-recycling heat shock protein